MLKNSVFFIIALTLFIGCSRQSNTSSHVVTEGDKTFIVDKTGYRWDVTQARSIGFNPDKFQYGIGKDAIQPLDDSGLIKADKDVPGSIRIIGVEEGTSAQAYSVQKLQSHEVVNSTLGSQPIAVGY